ncbi:amino acid adenylation domain-containing protein [Pseudomonas sp. GOM7]|uniref:non-ribosomal peptide synthetase n=1 Tax=Pseudomonas sp. GOM7 TaxID=2998079 RepID=UPI00227D11B5|nr:non-ribosomal peptide synthetase [Pseudomonas sp. GOM7]WAJ35465.1 amino acid adenylation domain-containing protein [Pseudomonas sp. GOM7]
MNVIDLLAVLEDKGIELSLNEDQLLVRGRKQSLAEPATLALIKEHKPALLQHLKGGDTAAQAPGIPEGCARLTPEHVPHLGLSQAQLERIAASVPGGAANVQDIYPLAPLQEGILYHHISARQGDPYLLQSSFTLANRERLEQFCAALQGVIDRHDILRTSLHWQQLDAPLQVVWRQARLKVTDISNELDPQQPLASQWPAKVDPRQHRLNLSQAPLLHLLVGEDRTEQRWQATLLFHHLAIDHAALAVVQQEMQALLLGQGASLPPALPYRAYVEQARRAGSKQEHEAFFTQMLGDVSEPTLAFGQYDVLGDGQDVLEAHHDLPVALCQRLHQQARQHGVSTASLCHLAWARLLGALAGRDEAVFGTVLLGSLSRAQRGGQLLGMVINTLPMRVVLREQSVAQALKATHGSLIALMNHEQAPLALAQRCSQVAAPTPLFNSLFNYRHSAAPAVTDAAAAQAWQGITTLSAEERTNYPLLLSVDDFGQSLRLTVQALRDIDAAAVAAAMGCVLEQLAKTLELGGHTPLLDLHVLPAAQRAQLLALNPAASDYPREQTLHGLFAAQAQTSPDALAVIDGEVLLSYAELNTRANQLAHYLVVQGVVPGSKVALLLPRSADLLVAQLAVLKCAAAYVPLDVHAPVERQAFMLDDCQAACLISLSHEPGAHDLPRLDLDRLDLSGEARHDLTVEQAADTPAYVMYTSGSTGQPKGVVVPHRAVARLVLNNGYAEFNAQDRVAFAANPAFDASTLEVWAPLLNGGAVVVVEQNILLDRARFAALLSEQAVSVLWLTAGLFHQYAASLYGAFSHLRYLIVGGDVLDPAVIAGVLKNGAPQHLLNGYGPTEATTFSSTYEIREAGQGSVPIGRPLANTQLYVLDAQQQLAPLGVAGELYIGGDGLAVGYLNQPELTAERFIQHVELGRLYRTGDLVRWRADGNLEYLGRNDSQIKLRGFRIELGEIEASLARYNGIEASAVLLREDTPGDKRLVAYFTATQAVAIEALRDHLQGELPEYMVPSAYVQLDSLPLTANGKLDRKALPAPDASALLSRAYEAPQTDTERTLAAIWQSLLGVEQVGRHDNFFELGGHSLLAVSLVERMREQGLSADVRVLFSQPTLAALAAAVGESNDIKVPDNLIPQGCTRITPELLPLVELQQSEIDRISAQVPGGAANIQDIYPLAPLQEGILYHHLSAEGRDPYVLQATFKAADDQRLADFCQALQGVIDRHDILRTAVFWEQLSQPLQVVLRQASLVVERLELDGPDATLAERLQAQVGEGAYRFDLRQPPLLRLSCARCPGSGEWVMLLLFHHLILDHTALEVVRQDMQALLLGEGQRLPPAMPYRNYVAQARLGAGQAAQEAFFRDMLGDIDEPTLAYGHPVSQLDGSSEARLPLDRGTGLRLRAQARQRGVSAASLMHLAWGRVLAALAGREQVVFGTVLMGRLQAGEGADRALGMFINTLPLRLAIDARPLSEALRDTHARLSGLLVHEHASLSLAQRCSGVAAPAPLFNSLFNYRHSAVDNSASSAQAWQGIEALANEEHTHYPLAVSVDDLGEAFSVTVLAAQGLDASAIGQRLCATLAALADALECEPQAPLCALPVVNADERQQLLEAFNATARPYPREATLQALFESQVAERPQATAAVHGDERLSYAQLNTRANQLAHGLRERGVVAGTTVAILLPRSLDLLVAQLAILKCAAVYVPLDIHAPAERQSFMLGDSGAAWLLSHSSLEAPATPRLDLDTLELAAYPQHNPPCASTALTPAYIMYTSGSTGTPKGVIAVQRGIVKLVRNNGYADFDSQDRLAFASNPAFDASTMEVWGALLNGGQVVVIDHELLLDPPRLAEALAHHEVTVLFVTTAVFNQYVALIGPALAKLRVLLCGGERADAQVFRDLLAIAPHLRLVHCYGPTETTTYATTEWVTEVPEGQDFVPIGKPLANTQVYVLDEHQQLLPQGLPGEICIGGDGMAQGYLNRPELDARSFIRDPFSAEPDARLYRSGDLGRWSEDGRLEHLGRKDGQVKIRGFRIEPGEIEARLHACPGLHQGAVVVRDDAPGGKLLVAYYTAEQALAPETVRSWLSDALPDYMVPAACICLEHWPLNGNGKLDRKALPAPDPQALAGEVYQAPQGPLEVQLAQLWQDVLKVPRVGRQDNFFSLGGHSLLAVTLIERMRQQGLAADVKVLFGQPTVAALAAALGQVQEQTVPANLIPPGCTRLTPAMLPLASLDQASLDAIVAQVPGGAANVQDIYALAPLQEGLLYHHAAATEGDPFILQSLFSVDSQARLEQVTRALQAVIERHDALRTAVFWQGLERPVQVVLRQARLRCEVIELPAGEGDAVARMHQRHDASRYRMDLRHAPLLELHAAWDGAMQRFVVALVFHHLILDHVAFDVVIEEMQRLMLEPTAQLPEPVPYRHYIAQVCQGATPEQDERFFHELLQDVREPTLPFGLDTAVGTPQEVQHACDPALAERARQLTQRLGVSAASLWHLAWGVLVGHLAGRQDVVFGTVLMGRLRGGEGADRAVGMFINTLPLRLDTGSASVTDGLQLAHRRLSELLAHEQAPLALAQRCSGVAAPAPLFGALLNYRHSPVDDSEQAHVAWQGITGLQAHERTSYPLSLAVDDLGRRGFKVTVQATGGVDAQCVQQYLMCTLQSLIEALEQQPQLPLQQMQVLPGAARQRLLYEFNATAADYPRQATLQDLFEAQAQRTPSQVAVSFGEQQLSYAELERQANRLAHHLQPLLDGRNAPVALCVPRGLPMLVGLLGILKAGGCYVPLDPAYPAERLDYMLQDSAPVALLTLDGTAGPLTAEGIPLIALADDAARQHQPDTPPVCERAPEHLAYVIYTSGSTGQPKGVMVEQRGLVNLLWAMAELTDLQAHDRLLALTTLGFDIAGLELYLPLIRGACCVLLAREQAQDAQRLAAAIEHSEATLMQATPATWRMLLDSGWAGAPGLKALCGGEALPSELAQRLRPRVAALWNVYGPTETTIWSSAGEVLDAAFEGATVSIGRPLANTRFYVLDEQQQPVPEGGVGELYIGGDGVARGYLNRAALSAERFLNDPFVPGARMYRTGDLARYRSDASLEFLGRNDFQVKIRGHRIELGEVEAQLAGLPQVRQAVVGARPDAAGDLQLVAWYTGQPLAEASLRDTLSRALPAFMLPTRFMHLDSLPLTPNGKLDRNALPLPEVDAVADYVAPQGELETRLAELWASLLQVPQVGREHDFFALGGHSLLAMRLLARIREQLGQELSLRALFEQPTLKAMARQLEPLHGVATPVIIPAGHQGQAPLTFAQQRLLFLARLEGASAAYHLPVALRLEGVLDTPALERALLRIVERHEVLRTVFRDQGRQHIVSAPGGFALRQLDWSGRTDSQAALAALGEEYACSPFDLANGPLLRACLVRLEERQHVLLVTLHHLIADGVSMGILTQELSALYQAFSQNQADPLPALPVQYADYAVWQQRLLQSDAWQAQVQWWQDTLSQAPTLLSLPTDLPRPATQSYAGARLAVCLDSALTTQLKAFSQRHGATLYMTVLAAWAVVLGRLADQRQVVIGSPVANRASEQVEGVIGLFANTLALPVRLEDGVDSVTLLQQVRTLSLEAQARQAVPFEHVVERVKPLRSLAYSPLFQVMLAWQNQAPGELALGELRLSNLPAPTGTAKFDLTLELGEFDGCLQGSLEYATALFLPATAERHRDYLERVLRAMVAEPERALDSVALPGAAELEQLNSFNASAMPWPQEQTLHGLFEAQAARTPVAQAVAHGGLVLTYAQLNERANRLAQHLIAQGVVPDARVGICLQRGAPMLLAMLAVLKAGGAYVPLDPNYPAERIAYMLQDSEPAAVIGQDATLALLGDRSVVNLDSFDWICEVQGNPVVPSLTSSNLAYLIYTSGSTGLPKGVMIEHRNTVNFLTWAQQAFEPEVLQNTLFSTSLNFDLAVYECFAPLTTGGCVHVVENALAAREANVSLINTVPSALKALLESGGLNEGVHTVNVAGEALKGSLVDKLFAETSVQRLCNLYGPSETTTYSSWVAMDRANGFVPHIGKPVGNTQFYLLDEHRQPVPLGVAGELYIGGAGVARGYLNRDDLTAERFLADPFSREPGARMYRTGDLARWLADGNLEYLGRNDDQVKIRGFRIELGEIEACLAQHPGVMDVAVMAREDAPGDLRLVAYLRAEQPLQPEALRAYLHGQLPQYMVPAAYVQLASLPLTPNGKLDRKALPAPDATAYPSRSYEAPQAGTETLLAELWKELLNLEQVGRHDHFFELGGHSLLAVTLVERLERQGLEVDIQVLFGQSTLAALAAATRPSQSLQVPPSRIPALQRKRRI